MRQLTSGCFNDGREERLIASFMPKDSNRSPTDGKIVEIRLNVPQIV